MNDQIIFYNQRRTKKFPKGGEGGARVQVDSALGQFGNQNSDQSKDRLGLDIQSQQACL